MRARRCGGPTGRGRVPEHSHRVSRLLGVVREPREVASLSDRVQDCGVKRPAPVRRHGALDRQPRKLVPERDGVALVPDDARVKALVQVAELRGDQLLE